MSDDDAARDERAAALAEVVDDLVAEHDALDAVVAPCSADDLLRPTPAAGWDVRDQLAHLTFFDRTAHLAATDPEAFRHHLDEVVADADAGMAWAVEEGRATRLTDVVDRWRHHRRQLVWALRGLDPAARLPWYGPAMGARSFATARLMETWAHGQDIRDALGAPPEVSPRLRHIAHLGVAARPFSYVVRGLEPPAAEVRVELSAPGGGTWTWGPEGAVDRVSGEALDWCLVVTQRRNLLDVGLVVEGALAAEWLGIAQAFAGAPGPGRPPLDAGA